MLTPHFDLHEFEKNDPIPDACIPVLTDLCCYVLEPVREKFGPLVITSGYRSPEANAEAHGQANSEHIYTPAWAAADFCLLDPVTPINISPSREVFDWMRSLEGEALPFHQLILEHGANGSNVIHVSINKLHPGLRSVLEGATHNASEYVKIDHVEYNPPSNREDVQEAENG